MLRIEVQAEGLAEAVAALIGARDRARALWEKTAYDVGAKGVRHLIRTYRSAPETTATATTRRSGMLARSYRHEVARVPDGVDLTVGLVRPDAKVLVYGWVHEYGATIKAQPGKYLTFPLRRGGGLADSNIIGWRRTKQVKIPARPALAPTAEMIGPELQRRAAEDLRRAVGA